LDNLALKIVLYAPIIMFSIIAHEIAHGYAALRQGDTTAYSLGRLTWNPIKHIDPVMTILLPLILIATTGGNMVLAGAKPVPVNPRNYRQYRRGDIIVSLAGVAVNFIIALACTVLIALFGFLGRTVTALHDSFAILQVEMIIGVYLNLGLIAFNLLPIPPLDGSHVMKYLLPPAWSLRYQQIGFFGIFILLLLMQTPFLGWWMTPAYAVAGLLLGGVQSLVLPHPLLQMIFG
jgi:Zn-dependent protease